MDLLIKGEEALPLCHPDDTYERIHRFSLTHTLFSLFVQLLLPQFFSDPSHILNTHPLTCSIVLSLTCSLLAHLSHSNACTIAITCFYSSCLLHSFSFCCLLYCSILCLLCSITQIAQSLLPRLRQLTKSCNQVLAGTLPLPKSK